MNLYITEQGATLSASLGRLRVTKDNQTLADIPLNQVKQIILLGHIHLTTRLIHHCLKNGVDVCYCSQQGKYKGRLVPEDKWHVGLRQMQYNRLSDSEFALRQARNIVLGKLRNQSALLQRFSPRREEYDYNYERWGALERQIAFAPSIESLLGYEGMAADIYFQFFASRLPEGWDFSGRSKRRAPDPINSMLSLSYTLIYHQTRSAIQIVGLDPYLGCLHKPRHGHAALASDLMEEYRAVLADHIVLYMTRHREIKPEHFVWNPAGGYRLTQEKLKHFLSRFDTRLDELASVTPDQQRHSYRRLIINQAQHFARVVQGHDEEYVPYRWTRHKNA